MQLILIVTNTFTMLATTSHEMHDGKLTLVLHKRYDSGAESKSYLDKNLMPFDLVWVKPLPGKLKMSDVIKHYNTKYRKHYGLN
jgi:hypothetical protein